LKKNFDCFIALFCLHASFPDLLDQGFHRATPDLRIVMVPQPGQDGVCGNFNANPRDDTTETIMQRIGARVSPSDDMLSGKAFVEITEAMKKMLESECPKEHRKRGLDQCTKGLPAGSTGDDMQSCLFDVCFGYNDHARLVAKRYA